MGKGGELWDDSALVDALDRAVATYKAMHGKNAQATPCENGKPEPAAAAAAAPISAEARDEHGEKGAICNNIPCVATETLEQPFEERKTIEQAPLQETDPGKEKLDSESKTLSSDVTDADRNVSSSQQGEHNELLRRYYELEEQSRNVLQQLQQTNYWNYQAPEYASSYQQQQVPAYNATAPDPHSSTAQSSCFYWNVPLVSVSCCSAGQPSGSSASVPLYGGCSISMTCDQCPGASTTFTTGENFMQHPIKVSTNDDQITKTAMMTAEGAFNFMRSTISGDRNDDHQEKETETGKESTGMGVWPNFDTTGKDSDLAVVLNAWFAAGFQTGRYLTQQSMKNS